MKPSPVSSSNASLSVSKKHTDHALELVRIDVAAALLDLLNIDTIRPVGLIRGNGLVDAALQRLELRKVRGCTVDHVRRGVVVHRRLMHGAGL